MNLIKKLAIGAATAAFAAASLITPVFADSEAYNENVTNGDATAIAEDNDTNMLFVTNRRVRVRSRTVVRANSGGNQQSFNGNRNTLTVHGSSALGSSENYVCETIVNY